MKIAAWVGGSAETPVGATHYGESTVVSVVLGPTAGQGTVVWTSAASTNTALAKPFPIVHVVRAPQTINFPEVPEETFGDGPFEVIATASSGLPVSFQSSNPSVATVDGNTVSIVGAGTTTLTASQAGNAAYLPAEVSQILVVKMYVPVTFTLEPQSQVVPLRGTATFSASAAGQPAPTYQWLFNGQPLPGANGPTLILTNVNTNSLGTYAAVAMHPHSIATSSPAMLLMSPSLRAPFAGAILVWGKSGSVVASAVGSGDLTYQWFKDGVTIAGATGPSLDFPAVQFTDAGLYSVVVSSPWGSITNTPAQLIVNPANISLEMYAGVTIDGVPGLTYRIQYSTNLQNTNAWITVTNYTLTLPVETWIDFDSPGKAKRFYRVAAP